MADLGAMELMQYQDGMNDQQRMMFNTQFGSAKKDRTLALILSLFLGTFGADRFYLGETGLGIAKLLTFGGCGIWAIVDWFLVMGKTDEYNRRKAHEIATAIRGAVVPLNPGS